MKPPRKPKEPPYPYGLSAEQGVFHVTGSPASELYLRHVEGYIARAEKYLAKKLDDEESAGIKQQLPLLKMKVAAAWKSVAAGHPLSAGEIFEIGQNLSAVREFTFKHKDNDDRMAFARLAIKTVTDEQAEVALALAIETARRDLHGMDLTPWAAACKILEKVCAALEADSRWVIEENRKKNRKKKNEPVSLVRRAPPKVDVLYRRLKNSAIN
jgi:hypothetical protein